MKQIWLVTSFAVLALAGDYELGVSLFEKGRVEEAIAPLTRATQSHPQDARAWKALGVVHASQGDYERAEPAFALACRLDARLPDACYFFGRALYALNKFEGSMEVLRKLPATTRVHLGIAQALEALGRADQAEEKFKSALRMGVDEKAAVAYAVFLFRRGRVVESLGPLEAILKSLPDSSAVHIELGRSYYQLERFPDAVRHLQRGLSLDPASGKAKLLLDRSRSRMAATQGSEIVK